MFGGLVHGHPARRGRRKPARSLPDVREIIADPARLYADLQRTEVTFADLTDAALAERLDGLTQVLCIVGTKAQARTVFELLRERENARSTCPRTYPAHRRSTLDAIRQRLKDKRPCRVISTSLIEAGVDVDFPVVYRAMSWPRFHPRPGRGPLQPRGSFGWSGPGCRVRAENPPRMPWLQRCASRAGETLRTLPAEDPLRADGHAPVFRTAL